MSKFMDLCLVLGTIILNIASLVQGACDAQAQAKCTASPSSDIELPPGVPNLFQSSVGRSVMRSDSAMGLHMYDLEESLHRSPAKSVASRDDYTFYLGICVDILVCLLIIEGWRRFQRTRRKRSVAPTKTPKVAIGAEDSSDDPEASSLVLHAAVCSGDTKNCEALLQKDQLCAKRILREGDKWGRTALHLAMLRGSESMGALVLKFGAKVDVLDAWDHAPLHCAAYSGSVECCRLLIQHGAEVNVVDAGERTPLHVAADLGHEAVCRMLLDHGGTLSEENAAEVPALLSALLVERMFQHPSRGANRAADPDMLESSSKDSTTEFDDEWQRSSLEDGFYYPEDKE